MSTRPFSTNSTRSSRCSRFRSRRRRYGVSRSRRASSPSSVQTSRPRPVARRSCSYPCWRTSPPSRGGSSCLSCSRTACARVCSTRQSGATNSATGPRSSKSGGSARRLGRRRRERVKGSCARRRAQRSRAKAPTWVSRSRATCCAGCGGTACMSLRFHHERKTPSPVSRSTAHAPAFCSNSRRAAAFSLELQLHLRRIPYRRDPVAAGAATAARLVLSTSSLLRAPDVEQLLRPEAELRCAVEEDGRRKVASLFCLCLRRPSAAPNLFG